MSSRLIVLNKVVSRFPFNSHAVEAETIISALYMKKQAQKSEETSPLAGAEPGLWDKPFAAPRLLLRILSVVCAGPQCGDSPSDLLLGVGFSDVTCDLWWLGMGVGDQDPGPPSWTQGSGPGLEIT